MPRQLKSQDCSRRCGQVARGALTFLEPLPERSCALATCGTTFVPKTRVQRCCSEQHGRKLWRIEAEARGYKRARPWDDKRRDAFQKRRALKLGASTGEPVILADIAERDRWRCQLCKRAVSRKRRWPDPLSPSMDHIVPLTRGGAHDPSNVQLAHLRCNVSKGNRGGGEQLALIG